MLGGNSLGANQGIATELFAHSVVDIGQNFQVDVVRDGELLK